MILEELKSQIASALKISRAEFSYPPRVEMGDLSLACFDLAKGKKMSPDQVAKNLAEQARSDSQLAPLFNKIEAVGPYLNFFLSTGHLSARVLSEVKRRGRAYGSNQVGQGKKVMIEYSNGNTHKEYHVGHLRNITYGDSIYRLLAVSGYEVVPVSYVNDFGIHVAKAIWNWRRGQDYQNQQGPKGYILGQCYAEASQALATDPASLEEVGRIMKQIESRQGDNYRTWQKTRRWSINYFQEIYKELGVRFRKTFYESEVIEEGLKLVEEFLERGIFKRSEGAIIADLQEYDLGVLPIIRSDGTALYAVADLALASEKFRRFSLDESIYVVDIRQSLYFKQLFKILELAGFNQALLHLPYNFVTLPEGMMASRTGNVITYQILYDRIKKQLLAETTKRHPDWSASRLAKVVKALTVATIKFEMLKVSPDKTITFNINEAVRFDGYTACYLEYGYARLMSIVRKHGLGLFGSYNPNYLTEVKEKELLLKIAKYPRAVWLARQGYNPSELTKYLFELVQVANDYYHEVNILKAEPSVRVARLALVKATIRVLENGFSLLGIVALKEM